jgi:hypothetical protein
MRGRTVGRSSIILVLTGAFASGPWAQSQDTLSLQDRVVVASKIYFDISTFFPQLDQASFDGAYRVLRKKFVCALRAPPSEPTEVQWKGSDCLSSIYRRWYR